MPPRKYSDEELARAVATSRTMRDVLVGLGLAPYGGNYERVRIRIRHLGLDVSISGLSQEAVESGAVLMRKSQQRSSSPGHSPRS